MSKLYKRIIESIGNTPLVEIDRLNPNKKVRIFAKIESANPGGSIKDRTALFMIEGAEKRGELNHDKIILEATSGNTGIGLAMIAAVKGYKLCLAMPESASEERKKILRALGAELHFTPANLGTDGSIELVYTMLRENPDKYYGTDQFNNEDNVAAHYYGTAQEIWDQTEGTVTMVVASLGTSGTAMGISKRLKELNPDIQIIGVEPYLKHKIQGLKNMRESYRPGIFDRKMLDEKINIQDEDAFEMARRLAREEGILAGMSSGAAMFIAAQKARKMQEGTIVVIFPDSGERYLSTELFAYQKETSTIYLYDTLKRRKVLFKSIVAGEIGVRTCGPTIHDVPHLGKYRRLVVSDLISRYMTYKGYQVKHVVDIVDLSDKSIQASEKVSQTLDDYTSRYLQIFMEDTIFLGIRPENVYVKASENIESMLKIVEKLIDKGFAYEKLHSVYFNISRLKDYGALTNINLDKTRQAKSVDVDEYEKDSPGDFALLKRSSLAELKRGIYYKTVWGNVRPSWHLECASISQQFLGSAYDIHISGADEIFPHCENILAINKGFWGNKGPNYWISTELVMVGDRKMSRSFNNDVPLAAIRQRGFSGRDVRFFLMAVHYRKPVHYSERALENARNTVKKLQIFIQRLQSIKGMNGDDKSFSDTEQFIYELKQDFEAALDDDFNISGALVALFSFVRKINVPLSQNRISEGDALKILGALKNVNEVLGIMDFEVRTAQNEIEALLAKREKARSVRNWEEADLYRKKLAEQGIDVLDTPQGVIWRYKG
jgi:cysteinyl-tRNA synthetase